MLRFALLVVLTWALAWDSRSGSALCAEEPAPAAPTAVHYADVSARLLQHDTPLWLHVRIEADGWMGLRSAADATQPEWKPQGTWRFTGVPAEDMDVLRGLHQAFLAALGGATPAPALRSIDQHSLARVLLDVAPEVAWRRAQWVVTVGTDWRLRLWRLTFLAPDAGTWFDVDVPKEGHGVNVANRRSARFLEVRMFRKGVGDPPAAAFTRLRLTSQARVVYGDMPEVLEETTLFPPEPNLPDKPGAPVEAPAKQGTPAETILIDLPTGAAPSGAHAGAWRRVAAFLATPSSEALRLGEIRTPPPGGAIVPTADVIEVMLLLRDAGCVSVSLEGAPPPLDRNSGSSSWDFFGR